MCWHRTCPRTFALADPLYFLLSQISSPQMTSPQHLMFFSACHRKQVSSAWKFPHCQSASGSSPSELATQEVVGKTEDRSSLAEGMLACTGETGSLTHTLLLDQSHQQCHVSLKPQCPPLTLGVNRPVFPRKHGAMEESSGAVPWVADGHLQRSDVISLVVFTVVVSVVVTVMVSQSGHVGVSHNSFCGGQL